MFLTGVTLTFLKQFLLGIWLTSPMLLSFAAIIFVLGQAVGRAEKWQRFESFYWAFITATTVGYGDLRPIKRRSGPFR